MNSTSNFDKHISKTVANDLIIVVISVVILVISALSGIYFNLPIDLAAISTTLSFFVLVVCLYRLLKKRRYGIEIYLDKKTSGDSTLFYGKAAAQKIGELDALCRSLEMPLLTSFGFKDDLRGEEVYWHSCDDGLRVLDAILSQIQSEGDDHWAEVCADLLRWKKRLMEAKSNDAKFALLIRAGSGVSGVEFERRKGYF